MELPHQVEHAHRRRQGPRDVGGKVHDVRQVQHAGFVGHVDRRAVLGEYLGDRVRRVRVLLTVLRGARELGRAGQVAHVVTRHTDRSGKHARRHQSVVNPRQQLGGRADHPVHVERPAHVVIGGEVREDGAHIDGAVGTRLDGAGEHHLVDLSSTDARHGRCNGGGPAGLVALVNGDRWQGRHRGGPC